MTVRIRPLRSADYDAMIRLFRACGLRPRVSGRDRRDAIEGQLRSKANVYLAAVDGDRLVGTVLGTQDTRKGWVNRLAVDPSFRRRGIAKRLLRACERGLRHQGIEMFAALIETDNKISEKVFRAAGYELIPMTYARRKLRKEI